MPTVASVNPPFTKTVPNVYKVITVMGATATQIPAGGKTGKEFLYPLLPPLPAFMVLVLAPTAATACGH